MPGRDTKDAGPTNPDSLQTRIGVRMAFEPEFMWHLDAAEPNMIALGEAVHVETGARANIGQRARSESVMQAPAKAVRVPE